MKGVQVEGDGRQGKLRRLPMTNAKWLTTEHKLVHSEAGNDA
jgi:hypothetical protein